MSESIIVTIIETSGPVIAAIIAGIFLLRHGRIAPKKPSVDICPRCGIGSPPQLPAPNEVPSNGQE